MGEPNDEDQKALEARALEDMRFWVQWVMRKALAEHEAIAAENSLRAAELRRALQ